MSGRWVRAFWHPLTFADKALIVATLVACAIAYDAPWRAEGGEFQVRVAGTARGPFPLGVDKEYEFQGPLGPTLISAKGGLIRVTSSPCPNRICMRSGAIGRTGQAIACIPNRLIAEVRGPSTNLRFDAVAR